jgi:transposase
MNVTSRERVPCVYQVLPGATADVTTAPPHLRALVAFLERPECANLAVRPLVVGDSKMITPASVAAAHRHHLYYLGPWEASQVLTAFKAQDAVEKSYTCLKGPLRVRPLYLHSDQRVEGIMFISVLALLVRALLEVRCRRAGLRSSADRVLHAFASLYATDQIFVDGSRYCQLGHLTDFQQRVLETLGFPSPTRYLQRLSD